LRAGHFRYDIIDALAKTFVTGRGELQGQCAEVVAERVTRDALRLPASIDLSLWRKPGVLARVVQKAVGIETEEILSVPLAGALERTVEQLNVAECEVRNCSRCRCGWGGRADYDQSYA
jgi:hypothetical protein